MRTLPSLFCRLCQGGLFTAVFALSQVPIALAVSEGDALPKINVKAYEQAGAQTPRMLDQAALVGKITVINFWATWCAACKVELGEMQEKFKPLLNDKRVQFAFVSLDKDPDNAADWFKANLKDPKTFLSLLYADPSFAVADQLGVDAFPMTLVIGRDGKVKHLQKGFSEGQGSTDRIVETVKKLL